MTTIREAEREGCIRTMYELCKAINPLFGQSLPPRGNGTLEAEMEYRQTPWDCARYLEYKQHEGPWQRAMELAAEIHLAASRLACLLEPDLLTVDGREFYGRMALDDEFPNRQYVFDEESDPPRWFVLGTRDSDYESHDGPEAQR